LHGTSSGKGTRKFHFWRLLIGGEITVGHYLLLFDYARESGSGRFIADINSVNHIGFLRKD
ncbi:hypothetical protein KWH37_21205, partial [Xanthomonas campestris pv. carissae]|nr:hypothetical protein [Xanthomonas campestris pv. carissae]